MRADSSSNLRGRFLIQPHSDKLGNMLAFRERVIVTVYIQDRNAVVGKILNLLVPTRGLEVAVAPRVIVKGKEIRSLIITATVHVHGCLHAVGGNIGGGVSNGDLAESSRVDVVLHITSDSLDVGSRLVSSWLVVDDLIAREEGQRVVILGKHLNSSKNALKVHGVVGGSGLKTVDGVAWVVDVKNQVDAGISEGVHALVVILGVVDSVNTNSVDAKVLEVLDITEAGLGVSEGILVGRSTTRLVVDTTKVEALAISPESYKNSSISAVFSGRMK